MYQALGQYKEVYGISTVWLMQHINYMINGISEFQEQYQTQCSQAYTLLK